jgi:hypothetical protein
MDGNKHIKMNINITPISNFVKSVKRKYDEAYARGMQRPAVQKAKANMTSGAKNNINF